MTNSSGFGEKALLTYTNCKTRKQKIKHAELLKNQMGVE